MKTKHTKRNTKSKASVTSVVGSKPGIKEHLTSSNKIHAHASILPSPFPYKDYPNIPNDRFLENVPPFQKAFATALDTCYEGLAIDPPACIEQVKSEQIKKSLQEMEKAGLFRYDITQPFGLGTKCAKTYVSRCLVGEEGTTYRYLGLRMFAYPWNSNLNGENTDQSLKLALHSILKLNEHCEARASTHLEDLKRRRLTQRDSKVVSVGSNKFDIALINRMDSKEMNLKLEPKFQREKCSVSWHADSSLEHYSTIAVYHLILDNDGNELNSPSSINQSWSIALRVSPNAEGPNVSPLKTEDDSKYESQNPQIKVTLPSGCMYYLLDDFNHHHQHAVLAPSEMEEPTIRYASTHRLLREGHNINFVLQRCSTCCSNFHRKGPKVWRSEQLLLSEIEHEWLRQFFIQGAGHKKLLWKFWENSISSLFSYWSKLEDRTHQLCTLLESAAWGRCQESKLIPEKSLSRRERKIKEKQKKSMTSIEELLQRKSEKMCVYSDIYDAFAVLIEDRATMREKWEERENDSIFKRISNDYKPIRFPVTYLSKSGDKSGEILGVSSMIGGEPKDLRQIANTLRQLGKAYVSQKRSDLPKLFFQTNVLSGEGIEIQCKMNNDWIGWKTCQIALEMQCPWAKLLLEGKKLIETRAYDLPQILLGVKIDILQSKAGRAGVSNLPDIVESKESINDLVDRIGWFTIREVIKYTSKEQFDKDKNKHLVEENSGYGWKGGKPLYGWVVGESGYYSEGRQDMSRIIRRMRSLFEINFKEDMKRNIQREQYHKEGRKHRSQSQGSSTTKKKKRRY